jgi:glycosyltransferase involved in cell wall biosynthesis
MTLRVLIYTHYWFPVIGGVQTVTLSLARGISGWEETHYGEKVEVTLATQTPAGGMDDRRLPFLVVRRPSKHDLFKLIRSVDVVHVANPAFVPLALGWLLQKPTVLEHDGYQSVCPNGLLVFEPDRSVCPGHFMAGRYGKCVACNSGILGIKGSLRNLLLTFPRRWLARRAIRNIAPSHHIGFRVRLPRTEIIYHGVPKSSSSGSTVRETRNGTLPCFAYVGRLELEKGVPVLLRASSILAKSGYSFLLRIVGDGAERNRLEELTKELGLSDRTHFVGSVSVESVPALLSDVTAVVMPSVWEDVAPLAASEQLMQGNLVIASDIGGLGEIVDGVGLKFPPGDAHGLYACMRQVLESPELVIELRAKAHRRGAEIFDEGRMVEEHVRLYQAIAGP